MRISDWSSDVCSSDLHAPLPPAHDSRHGRNNPFHAGRPVFGVHAAMPQLECFGTVYLLVGRSHMNNVFLDALKQRSTQYSLGRNLSAPKDELLSLIQEAVKHSPSSFNSQSSRALVLFGAESDKLWRLAVDEVRKVAPPESFAQTEAKLNSFAAGVGTVLFFEDQDVVRSLQEKFALYADKDRKSKRLNSS